MKASQRVGLCLIPRHETLQANWNRQRFGHQLSWALRRGVVDALQILDAFGLFPSEI